MTCQERKAELQQDQFDEDARYSAHMNNYMELCAKALSKKQEYCTIPEGVCCQQMNELYLAIAQAINAYGQLYNQKNSYLTNAINAINCENPDYNEKLVEADYRLTSLKQTITDMAEMRATHSEQYNTIVSACTIDVVDPNNGGGA